jgi:hypothetical protein
MFPYYNPDVINRLGVNSPLAITASYVRIGQEINVTANIRVTSPITTADNRVHFIVCEDGAHGGQTNLARLALPYKPLTIDATWDVVNIQRMGTLDPSWTGPLSVIVFVQSHDTGHEVLQAALAGEIVTTDTIDVSFDCVPDTGVLPFTTNFAVELENLSPYHRQIAGRIDVRIASGREFTNWKSGSTTCGPYASYTTSWNQNIPAEGTLVGDNEFTLYGFDVTPAPYNQAPYPAEGDFGTTVCTVTGIAP